MTIQYSIPRLEPAPLPPQIPGLPIVGSALKMRVDPLKYFVELYHQYGPIFRIQILNRHVTVMAGLEANKFLAREGNEIFSSEDLFGDFGRQMGTEIFLTAMDGKSHTHLRKIQRRGFSRSALVPHIPAAIEIMREFADEQRSGDFIGVLPTFQRLVTEQIGLIATNRRPGPLFVDIRRFLNYLMNVEALKMWPKFMLHHPAYKRSKARVMEFGRETLEYHRQNPPIDREPNLIDDALTAVDENGNPYPEDALVALAVGPYFAGIDTVASSISFLLYNILKHPEIYERIQSEVDGVFERGIPTPKDFRDMPTLQGAIQETLRMYPVTPFTPRITKQGFEFAGYRVEAGSEVFVAQTVTHYLPEFYERPHVFDVDRHNTQATPTTFAPYTTGSHTCLGAGLAEAQMMVFMAALLRYLKLELETPNYTVKIRTRPLPNPGQDFRVRVVGKH